MVTLQSTISAYVDCSFAKQPVAQINSAFKKLQAQATVALRKARVIRQEALNTAIWAYMNPGDAATATKAKAIAAGTRAREIASDPAVQTSAASAAGGAAAMGTTGAAAGFIGGGAVGAAMGVPAAFFTFGMSIPLGAAVGSAAGLFTGAAVGGGVGLVGGGAAGYGAYTNKDKLKSSTGESLAKLKCGASDLRKRIVGRGSGKA